MGLLDKVKAQATQVAGKAQEAGRAGQAKLEEVQARRRVDTLLRQPFRPPSDLALLSMTGVVGHAGRASRPDPLLTGRARRCRLLRVR